MKLLLVISSTYMGSLFSSCCGKTSKPPPRDIPLVLRPPCPTGPTEDHSSGDVRVRNRDRDQKVTENDDVKAVHEGHLGQGHHDRDGEAPDHADQKKSPVANDDHDRQVLDAREAAKRVPGSILITDYGVASEKKPYVHR